MGCLWIASHHIFQGSQIHGALSVRARGSVAVLESGEAPSGCLPCWALIPVALTVVVEVSLVKTTFKLTTR
jgi:hypothetical protein